MREILFKAKRIDNGEWVHGNYAFTNTNGEQHFIFQNKAFQHEVDKNTICQYTGLKDKNGNKIWENDILKDFYYCMSSGWTGESSISVVEHLYTALSSGWYRRGIRSFTVDKRLFTTSLTIYNQEAVEVIGNIFDNPELLKEG